MTNYNERLDKILKTSHHRIRTRILRGAEIYQSHIVQSEYDIKQDITSLTKELVDEQVVQALKELKEKSYKVSQDIQVSQYPARSVYQPEIVKAYDSVVPLSAIDKKIKALEEV